MNKALPLLLLLLLLLLYNDNDCRLETLDRIIDQIPYSRQRRRFLLLEGEMPPGDRDCLSIDLVIAVLEMR